MAQTMPARSDTEQQAHPNTIELLRRLLAGAIADRELVLGKLLATEDRGGDRHWYCPGEDGYCLACNLPADNGRHVPRPV